jgi:hypothetical protein
VRIDQSKSTYHVSRSELLCFAKVDVHTSGIIDERVDATSPVIEIRCHARNGELSLNNFSEPMFVGDGARDVVAVNCADVVHNGNHGVDSDTQGAARTHDGTDLRIV